VQANADLMAAIEQHAYIQQDFFVHMSDKGAQEQLESRCLQLRPEAAPQSMPDKTAILNHIASLQQHPLYGFAGAEAQSGINMCKCWVGSLCAQRQPTFKHYSACAFLEAAKMRLARTFAIQKGDGNVSVANAVVAYKFAELAAEDKDCSDDLKAIAVYSWIRSRDENEQVVELAHRSKSKVVAAATAPPTTGAACSSGPSTPKAKAGAKAEAPSSSFKRKATADERLASTLAIFNKRKVA